MKSDQSPGPLLLRSALLIEAGVPHAFSTRRGGVSPPPFDSLNFGNPSELAADRRDPAGNIRENFRRVTRTIEPDGGDRRRLIEVHQVHGAAVHLAPTGSQGHAASPKADAIVTDDPLAFAVVRVADCAPVLVASCDGLIVAAIHAGWRGVVQGVAPAAVAAMRKLGAREFVGAVGPCIGSVEFEIGPEVAEEFRRAFGAGTPHVRPAGVPGKFRADLKAALVEQLSGAGVGAIDVLPHCTVGSAAEFFSHRRDKGLTGRMIGIIGPRAV